MISLPNGCQRSKISVIPKNWQHKSASTKKPWRIHYRFYDSNGEKKLIPIKGMNKTKLLKERQVITAALIQAESDLLDRGYNPISKQIIAPVESSEIDIDEFTPFFKALERAVGLLECENSTINSIKSTIKILSNAALKIKIFDTPIGQIKPKHILLLLKYTDQGKHLSAQSYNHYRAYLLMLFKQLFLLGACESNPVRDIPKRKVIRKHKTILTKEQRKLVDSYLKDQDYFFWRYMRIFYHSGSRSTEMLALKVKDVNLESQQYLVTVKKGAEKFEAMKTITRSALPFWKEAIRNADPEHFVFGWGFQPGPKRMGADRVTKRWYYLIKKPCRFGIDASFYSFKHANTTEVVDMLGEKEAAELNSHKSTAMVVKIYDTRQEERVHERLKQLNNDFL